MKNVTKTRRFIVGILFVLLIGFLCALYLIMRAQRRRPFLENYENESSSSRTTEIVVSRYNEDLNWLQYTPYQGYDNDTPAKLSSRFSFVDASNLVVTIYNKGSDDAFYVPPHSNTVNVPNVGVNVHTILFHIVRNYDQLADVTVFLPGSCMDEHKSAKTLQTLRQAQKTHNSVFVVDTKTVKPVAQEMYDFTLDEWANTNPRNHALNPESTLKKCDIRPFGAWYAHFFPNVDVYAVNYYVMFAVSRAHILQRSKASYEELLAQVNTDKNEESAHYFERAFLAVFHPIPEECLFLPE